MSHKKAKIHASDETLYNACFNAIKGLEDADAYVEYEEFRNFDGKTDIVLYYDEDNKDDVSELSALLTMIEAGGTYEAQLLSSDDIHDDDIPSNIFSAYDTAKTNAESAALAAQRALYDIDSLKTLAKAVPTAYRTLTDTEIDAETDYETLQDAYSDMVSLQSLTAQYMASQGQDNTDANVTAALALGSIAMAKSIDSGMIRLT